ncbi:hypothetical protein DGG96_17400 [Legionella qingyii]|uniref:Uncharacterized protein n=1 Tax=Legionella qingyii TaxID=2184757 RepID=A0A317TXS7_9GAMM|nr:hypothetical protein DGG96_17400 [Legionella qingyii]
MELVPKQLRQLCDRWARPNWQGALFVLLFLLGRDLEMFEDPLQSEIIVFFNFVLPFGRYLINAPSPNSPL